MSNPNEKKNEKSEPDDLELEPELVKDLDVDDIEGGQLRGGHSTISTAPLPAIGTNSKLR